MNWNVSMTAKYAKEDRDKIVELGFRNVTLFEKENLDIECKNRYHRYLNFSFQIQRPPECNGSLSEARYINFGDYRDPEIERMHTNLGIRTFVVETFYTPPHASLPIHSDEWPLDNHVKINISYATDDSFIRWWSPKSGLVSVNSYKDTIITDRENYNLLYKTTTNKPSLVNVGQLHDTYNPSDLGRWTLCFVPVHMDGSYIQWDEALEIYKDYIA